MLVQPKITRNPGEKSAKTVSHFLLLVRELGLADARSSQLHVQDPLHGAEHLLVGRGIAPLKAGDDGGRRVALCRQVLLGHLGLDLLPGGGNDAADLLADRVGLDDVVGAVDLCEALAVTAAGLLQC